MTKLTIKQAKELRDNGNRPIQVIDPATNKIYVLISAEIFQRIKSLIGEEDFDIRETYAAQFAAMDKPECWNAPGMELYDDYDAHKPE